MNIIELAKEAGLWPSVTDVFPAELERFAKLVRAEERKRTVEILMEMHRKANGQHNYYHYTANEIQGFSV